jgi:tetratricopeptide (TPR) repeat protein
MTEALSAFDESLRLNYLNINAAYARASLHNEMGNLDKAIEEYNAVMTLEDQIEK